MSVSGRATTVSPHLRRLAAALAAAVALTAAGIAPSVAATADTQRPVILDASMSKTIIDVVDGPVQVTVRIEIQDFGSGIAAGSPRLQPRSFSGDGGAIPMSPVMTRVSGDAFRGIYETTFTFPELIRSGEWYFDTTIFDAAGNRFIAPTQDAFESIGLHPRVVSQPDLTAPLVSATQNTNVVDVTDGPGSVTFTVTAQDAGIGIAPDAQIMVMAYRGSGGSGAYARNSSRDPHLARFRHTGTFPQPTAGYDPRGTYRFTASQIVDMNGNSVYGRDIGQVLVATRPLRAKRPALSTGTGRVTASWAAHPDPLGILEYEAEFGTAAEGAVRTSRTVGTSVTVNDLPAGTYTARVRARNQLGWGEWTTASDPVTYTLAALSAGSPAVTGKAVVGQSLTATTGTWTSGTALAYQWKAAGTAIAGATGPTLALGPAQAGKPVSVTVTGTKAGYAAAERTSAPTAAVAPGTLTQAPVPVITGTAKVGTTLRVTAGDWAPAPVALTYQWHRAGTPIAGATKSSYRATADDLGKALSVTVTGSAAGYTAAARPSAATAAVIPGSLTRATPTITGTTRVGSTLTAAPGAWGPVPVTFRYQWYRSGVAIVGAVKPTYRLTPADNAATITVKATASAPAYYTSSRTSAATAAVTPGSLTRATPTITGTAKVGALLTAQAGVWGPAPVNLTYRWYRAGVAIVGAGAATYTPRSADAGHVLTVKVTGSAPGYLTASRISAPTPAVLR